jgi:hypothetical protein
MDKTLKCPRCKKPFIKHDNVYKKFCSQECRYKQWVSENRDKLNKNVREYRARRYEKDGMWRDAGDKAKALKEWMNDIKSKPCCDCGKSFEVCCMDFDHREGTEKEYNVGTMFAHHYSKELIEKELGKCDLVCANCHRIRTRNRRKGNGKYKAVARISAVPEDT